MFQISTNYYTQNFFATLKSKWDNLSPQNKQIVQIALISLSFIISMIGIGRSLHHFFFRKEKDEKKNNALFHFTSNSCPKGTKARA